MYLSMFSLTNTVLTLALTITWVKVQNFINPELKKFKNKISCLNGQLSLYKQLRNHKPITICLIQYYEADLQWKVSLKILNSGIILKTFTHAINNLKHEKENHNTI